MSSSLWLSIEPRSTETRLLLSVAGQGTALKARLPLRPAHPHALVRLMEALCCYYRLPLHAVLDADAPDVLRDAEAWAQWTGDVGSVDVSVEWVGKALWRRPRDRFLDGLGDFDAAKRRIAFASGVGVPRHRPERCPVLAGVNHRVTVATRRSTAVNHRVAFSILHCTDWRENRPEHTPQAPLPTSSASHARDGDAAFRAKCARVVFTNGAHKDAHLETWLPERYRPASVVLKNRREPQQRTPEKRSAG